MEYSNVTEVLGGEKILQQRIQSRMDLIELSNKGVTKDALAHLANYLSFTMRQMAELLPITERTIQRYTPQKTFNRVVSEQILQIAEITAKGVEVFEDKRKFLTWMNYPNKALANKTPMSLLNSRSGTEMVLDELGRIEYGVNTLIINSSNSKNQLSQCSYCEKSALYRDRGKEQYLCLAHTRFEVTGPREEGQRKPLSVRAATAADMPRILELANYFWGEDEAECFGRTYSVEALPAYVACDGDEIVGVASFSKEGRTAILVMLHVLPKFQGHGAAGTLVSAMADELIAEGIDRVFVATTNDDLPALAFYQRLGFVIIGVKVGTVLERHGEAISGFAGIPIRDEIQLALKL